MATVIGTLLWIHVPRNFEVTPTATDYNDFNEIAWRHLLHGINPCKMKSYHEYNKETTVGLERQYCPSFTCMDLIINNDF